MPVDKGEVTTTTESNTPSCAVTSLMFMSASAKVQQKFDIRKFNMKKSETFCTIIQKVADCTEIPASEILSNCRKAEIVDARSIAIHNLYCARFSVREIMQRFSFRSHNSVRYNLDLYDSRYKFDCTFRELAQCAKYSYSQ